MTDSEYIIIDGKQVRPDYYALELIDNILSTLVKKCGGLEYITADMIWCKMAKIPIRDDKARMDIILRMLPHLRGSMWRAELENE